MAERITNSPSASNRVQDGNTRFSMDSPSDPRYEEAPLPTPPTKSIPAGVQDSPRTAIDTSELRERVDSVLQSDVSVEPSLCDAYVANGPQIGVDTLLNRLKQSIAAARVRRRPDHPMTSGLTIA